MGTIVRFCQGTIVRTTADNHSGTIVPVTVELLIRRIDERLAVLKAQDARNSERKLLLSAKPKLDPATIRRIRDRGQIPGPQILARLEVALGVPAGFFIEAVTDRHGSTGQITYATIYVKGAVQAGVYREAIEWNGDEWYSLTIPMNHDRFPGVERFGLEVRGNSMNRIYPEGSIVLVVRFGDIGRGPKSGERVVVLRRSEHSNEYEATLKEYELDAAGRHVLWPRSTDPEFQTPFVLSDGMLPVSQGYEPLPPAVSAGDLTHAAGEPDIVIAGLVVMSVRNE